jgi:hypothetical protein
MSLKPLTKDEETDAEVTWEDQNNINTFSKVHNKLIDLQDLLSERNVSSPDTLADTDTSGVTDGRGAGD